MKMTEKELTALIKESVTKTLKKLNEGSYNIQGNFMQDEHNNDSMNAINEYLEKTFWSLGKLIEGLNNNKTALVNNNETQDKINTLIQETRRFYKYLVDYRDNVLGLRSMYGKDN